MPTGLHPSEPRACRLAYMLPSLVPAESLGTDQWLAAIATAAAALVIAVIAWWIWSATKPATSPAVVTATSVAQPLVAPRMSIVVLPFANLSDDRDQQYFADGIT